MRKWHITKIIWFSINSKIYLTNYNIHWNITCVYDKGGKSSFQSCVYSFIFVKIGFDFSGVNFNIHIWGGKIFHIGADS